MGGQGRYRYVRALLWVYLSGVLVLVPAALLVSRYLIRPIVLAVTGGDPWLYGMLRFPLNVAVGGLIAWAWFSTFDRWWERRHSKRK